MTETPDEPGKESTQYGLSGLKRGLLGMRMTLVASTFYNLGGCFALVLYLYLVFGFGYLFQYADVLALCALAASGVSLVIFKFYSRSVLRFFKQKDLDNKIPIDDSLRRLVLNFPVIFAVVDFILWCIVGGVLTYFFIELKPDDREHLEIHLGLSVFFAAHLVAIFGFYANENIVARHMLPVLMKGRRVSDIPGVIPVPIYLRLMVMVATTALFPSLFLYLVFSIGDAKGMILLYGLALIAVNGVWQGANIVYAISRPIGILAGRFERLQRGEEEQNPPGFWRADALGRFFEMFNDLVRTIQDRDFIRSTFSRYVSREVVNEILNGDVELGGSKKEATVMFTDIRGFTTLSEHMSPEETVELLNEYFDNMVHSIIHFKGVPDKFIGDGIMAVWGVPVVQEDHTLLAVKAGLDMVKGLERFNRSRREHLKQELRIGIGLHCGELIAGNIGSKKKMEFTVIGDTVNTCSRIEGKCKDFGSLITVSEDVYVKLPADMQVLFEEEGEVHLRGKSSALKLFVLKEGRLHPADLFI